jgi:hypothetical protein
MSLRLKRLLTCHLAVCALLLKAAVPLLAATAGQLQGLPVAQLCSVYGVATVPTSSSGHGGHMHHHAATDAGHDGDPHSVVDHGHDHCALTAVSAMAVNHAAPISLAPRDEATASPPWLGGDCARFDECARWVARLAHGPPVRA